MYVVEDHRGIGYARRLLAELETRAAEAGGHLRLVLETGPNQPEAIALYESSGYTPIPSFGFYAGRPLARSFGKELLRVRLRQDRSVRRLQAHRSVDGPAVLQQGHGVHAGIRELAPTLAQPGLGLGLGREPTAVTTAGHLRGLDHSPLLVQVAPGPGHRTSQQVVCQRRLPAPLTTAPHAWDSPHSSTYLVGGSRSDTDADPQP